ncbi:hypothetical protein P7K49_009339, partial [Saguinus oedipus]
EEVIRDMNVVLMLVNGRVSRSSDGGVGTGSSGGGRGIGSRSESVTVVGGGDKDREVVMMVAEVVVVLIVKLVLEKMMEVKEVTVMVDFVEVKMLVSGTG